MGILKNLFSKDVKNRKSEVPVDKKAGTLSTGNSMRDIIIGQIENGEPYHMESGSDILDIFKDHMEFVRTVFGNKPTIIKYDEFDLPTFQLDNVENDFKGAWNTLSLYYYAHSDSGITTAITMPYDRTKKDEIEIIADYLSSKLGAKHEYDSQQKELAEKAEYERLHGRYRFSKYKFPFFDDDCYLKYAYYDVDVMGTDSFDYDISQIAVDADIEFVMEPENELDKNAIQIKCFPAVIGYVPKNNLQKMIHDYLDYDAKVVGFISKVDENERRIQIAIAFYRYLTDRELMYVPHIDAILVKTSKKDDVGTSRQENLDSVRVGDLVELEYQFDTDTYLVTDDVGNELGEINVSMSKKLQDFENSDLELHGIVIEMEINDAGKNTCKVRVLAGNA